MFQIDIEMFEAFTSKFNPNILESMQDLWKNECQKELKSVEIWKRKQSWLERYEEEYDFLVLCNFHLFLLCFSFSLYFDYNYIRDYCIQPVCFLLF
jgi:hypothetical protein